MLTKSVKMESSEGENAASNPSPANTRIVHASEGSDTDVQSVVAGSSTRSISVSTDRHVSTDDANPQPEVDRNMMLATLLEDYYRTKAVELLNDANPGNPTTRQSEEAQDLARRLFSQARHTLVSNGLLPASVMGDSAEATRSIYLTGLDRLVAVGGQGPGTPGINPFDSMHDLVGQTAHLSLVPHPANDMQLTLSQPRRRQQPRSYYQSSFREVSLLGKGGFGRVYQCYNMLDQKEYAVKKIPLSDRVGRRLDQGRHSELGHILREVQALANLDHPNIVRYFGTWFEEPQAPAGVRTQNATSIWNKSASQRRPLLLQDRSHIEATSTTEATDSTEASESSSSVQSSELSQTRMESMGPSTSGGVVFGHDTDPATSDGIVFGHDTGAGSEADRQAVDWSVPGNTSGLIASQSSMPFESNASDLFTDGNGSMGRVPNGNEVPEMASNEHVLYIQMSLYPMTLNRYLSSTPSKSESTDPRHCFHLAPTLQLVELTLKGLRHIHEKGLIHRDIKPGNIFLSAPESQRRAGYCDTSCTTCKHAAQLEGEYPSAPRWLNPRIADFGLVARLARGDDSASMMEDGESSMRVAAPDKPVGTAFYRPPTWPSPHPDDEKIDIFALGVVLVEMLCPCGTAMERVDMLKGLQEGVLPDSLGKRLREEEGFGKEVIDKVETLCRGMVAPDPRERYTGSQVETELHILQGALSQNLTIPGF